MINMSEEKQRPTKKFVKLFDTYHFGESGNDGKKLWLQLLDRKITSNEVDRKINTIVSPLSTQLECVKSVIEKTQ